MEQAVILVFAGAFAFAAVLYVRSGSRQTQRDNAERRQVLLDSAGQPVILGLTHGKALIVEYEGRVKPLPGEDRAVLEGEGGRQLIPLGQIRWIRTSSGDHGPW